MSMLRTFGLTVLTILVISTAAQAQVVSLNGGSGQSATVEAEAQQALDRLSASGTNEQDINAVLAELSDPQIRQIVSAVLRERLVAGKAAPQSTPLLERLNGRSEDIRDNLAQAFRAVPGIIKAPGFLYDSFNAGKGSLHIVLVTIAMLAIFLAAYLIERFGDAMLKKWMGRSSAASQSSRMGKLINQCDSFVSGIFRILTFSLSVFAIFFALWQAHEPTRVFVVSIATAVIVVRLMQFLARFALLPGTSGDALFAFDPAAAQAIKQRLEQAFFVLAIAAVLMLFLREFGFDRNGFTAINLLLATLVLLLLMRVVVAARAPVAGLIRGPGEASGWLARLTASGWHIAALLYLLFVYFATILARLLGTGDGETTVLAPGIVSIAIVLAVPFLSAVAKALMDAWKDAGRGGYDEDPVFEKPSLIDVAYRVARLGLVICAVVLIFQVWGFDVFAATERTVGQNFSRAIVNIGITAILVYALWLVVEVFVGGSVNEAAAEDVDAGGEGGGPGATRLETMLPLLRRFFQVTILVIGTMIVLSSMGLDIGPLIAGAGVIGLAIGFGAQKLVTDIISGLFYLIDDAFRAGEYVDIGDVKGRVEATNVRSLVLRHHRGPLHTVPYSEIKHLTNYSRDWVIVKLEFRVTYDTDVNRVKKIFKKIGQDLLQDPVLGEDFLQPFKSQGVKSMEESAMIVRGKFMAKPGKQFMIRKEIFTRVQKAFGENGIHFAHRRVAVDLPPGIESHPQAEKIAEAAAAAVAAADEDKPQDG